MTPSGVDLRAIDWDTLVDDAIGGERLSLHFQPVVDIQSCRVAGYETLARFEGAGSPGPDAVFAAARRLDRAAALDAAVIERALAWWRTIPRNCFLTVNVEPTSLVSDELGRVMHRAGRLDGLVIEVTEHVSFGSVDGVVDALDRLRTRGAGVAVDDAGSGYSGLQQILQLRPDFLKLDRALVAGIDLDEAKLALLDMLGALSNHLDAWIIAEGVERPAELATLRDHGVPLAQGYLLAMPGPAWAPIEPAAAALLAEPGPNTLPAALAPLLVATPYIEESALGDARSLLSRSGEDHLVVVDTDRRPLGTIDVAGAMDGFVTAGWKTNVRTELHDLAGRLAARPADRLPSLVLCHDDEGSYVGTVRIQRLLAALAAAVR